MKALSRRTLLETRDVLVAAEDHGINIGGLVEAIDAVLRPSPKKKAAKKANTWLKKAKRLTKNAETSEKYRQVEARADGRCECGCGLVFTSMHPPELDHFWGRGKGPQSASNTWMLTSLCHKAKTSNRPSAAYWLRLFIHHATKHNYVNEIARAGNRLNFVEARAELSGEVGR